MADEVGESIRSALIAMSAVTDLVGTGSSARVRPWFSQRDTIPAKGSIIIEVDSTEHLNSLDGLGGREYHDVNILCRAPTAKAARDLAEAVRLNGTDPGTGLAGYSGTPISTQIDCVLENSTGPTAVPRDDGSERPWWDVNMSFQVSQLEVV